MKTKLLNQPDINGGKSAEYGVIELKIMIEVDN